VAETRWRGGVIGAGFIGPVHVEALRRLSVEVVALAGSSITRAADKTGQFGIARSYGSAEKLLADPESDVREAPLLQPRSVIRVGTEHKKG
jgi:predicted dehydrogenase